ncbi:MAG: hypothetical protein EXS03_08335 [Phycisphaerales bacterium]|nr:hypothetical protein [Phycisphaerales bacterium]
MDWPLRDGAIVALVCAAVSWILVRITRRIAARRGWTAPVRADRWHSEATALFGGVGIIGGLLIGIGFGRGLFEGFRDATSANGDLALAVVAGAVLSAGIGLLDDIVHFRAATKLAAQVGCACAFLWACGGVEIIGNPAVDTAVGVVWIVAMMNAVNMLDNMDGVAASASTIALLGIGVASSVAAPGSFVAVVALAGAGATAGFLAQNLPRAKVFMGDSGSLMLGFLIAALALVWARPIDPGSGTLSMAQGWMATALAAVGFGFAPLTDLVVVSITRVRKGQSPMTGGRDHTTHRLAQRGWTGRGIVAAVATTSAIAATVATLSALGTVAMAVALGVLVLGLLGLAGSLMRMAIGMDNAARLARADTAHRREAYEPFVKVAIDVALIAAAMNLGYLVRWEWTIPPELTNSVGWSLPVVIACCVSANSLAGTYWRRWRRASWREVGVSLAATLAGSALSVVAVAALWSPERLFSRVAMALFVVAYPVLSLVVMGTFRARWR